jgi:hypothetical protein
MVTTMDNLTLAEQVTAALATFLAAHEQAEAAAVAYGDLKRAVGSNESERKDRKANTPSEDYAGYVLHLADAETDYKARAAAAERAEKVLNVLREMYSGETAAIGRAAAEAFAAGAAELNRAVDAWRRYTGTKPLMSEIRQRWAEQEAVPVAAGRDTCNDCGKSMALDIHTDCIPF